jgi:hypothetical protein
LKQGGVYLNILIFQLGNEPRVEESI